MNDQPTLWDIDEQPDVDAAHYYNTNRESGDTLAASELTAQQQQHLVLAFFQRNPHTRHAPHEVHAAVTDGRTPLTSIRRAITNLTTSGRLEKTPEMRPGTFGKQVHTWKLAAHNRIGAPA